MARLLSVNVGLPRDVSWQGEKVFTSVWKEPVQGSRKVRRPWLPRHPRTAPLLHRAPRPKEPEPSLGDGKPIVPQPLLCDRCRRSRRFQHLRGPRDLKSGIGLALHTAHALRIRGVVFAQHAATVA